MITLGATYEDSLSKIKGICTSHTRYLTGCDRVMLEYIKDEEIKELWVDANRVTLCDDVDVITLPNNAPVKIAGGYAPKPSISRPR